MPAPDAMLHLERELVAERAAALARIAETFERLSRRLAQAGAALAGQGATDGALAAYRALRREALRWRWYLEVQREAVGFLRHDDLERLYPVPPPARDVR
jgi:hypothetical protein